MEQINKRSKDQVIQFYRGIGCLSIIIYHFLYRYGEIYDLPNYVVNSLSSLGAIGVALFLIITGYFSPSIKKISLADQLKKKLISLYPPYFIAITLAFLVSLLGYLGEDRVVGFKNYLLNVILVNGFISRPYVDGAHWYVTYIVIFTIWFAYFNKKRISNNPMLYEACLIINIIVFFITRYIIGNNLEVLSRFLYIIVGNKFLGFIVIGVCVKFIETSRDRSEKDKWLLVLGSSLLFIFISYRSLVMFMFGVIFTFILYKRNYFSFLTKASVIVWIGDISYGIYLIHQNIGYSIMNYLRINFDVKFEITFVLALTLVVLLGALVLVLSKYIVKIIGVRRDIK